jgi:hypothetical protein
MLTAQIVEGMWVHADKAGHRTEFSFTPDGRFVVENVPRKVFDFGAEAAQKPGYGRRLGWNDTVDLAGTWKIVSPNELQFAIDRAPLGLGGVTFLVAWKSEKGYWMHVHVGPPDDFIYFALKRANN